MSAESKTILVVEDTIAMRNIERIVLESVGYKVIEASNVEEAVSLLEIQRPDLVLLDMNLAGESGLLVVDAVRNKYSTPVLPIIVLSASPVENTGVQAVLLKPITKPVLLDWVKAFLSSESI